MVYCITRSDDEEYYDENDVISFEDDLTDLKGLDYNYSGEFITDNDCYYVYFKCVKNTEEENNNDN